MDAEVIRDYIRSCREEGDTVRDRKGKDTGSRPHPCGTKPKVKKDNRKKPNRCL